MRFPHVRVSVLKLVVADAREEVVLVAGYAVRGTQRVIYAREKVVLVTGYAVRGTQ